MERAALSDAARLRTTERAVFLGTAGRYSRSNETRKQCKGLAGGAWLLSGRSFGPSRVFASRDTDARVRSKRGNYIRTR